MALADIEGRGLCIPSGKIEPGETLDAKRRRGKPGKKQERVSTRSGGGLIGCYRLTSRAEVVVGQVRYCPVFVAEAWGFEPIPPGSESRGLILAAWEDVADVYFAWDALMAAVFEYAEERRNALFPSGVPMTDIRKMKRNEGKAYRSEVSIFSSSPLPKFPIMTTFIPAWRPNRTPWRGCCIWAGPVPGPSGVSKTDRVLAPLK